MYIKEKRMTSWCHSAWAGAGMFYSEEMQLLVVFYDLLVSYPVYSYPAVVRVKPKVKKTSEARVSAGGRGGPSRRIQWKCSVSTSRTSSTSSIGTVTERPAQSPPCSGTGRIAGQEHGRERSYSCLPSRRIWWCPPSSSSPTWGTLLSSTVWSRRRWVW